MVYWWLNRDRFAPLESATGVIEQLHAHRATTQEETEKQNHGKGFHGHPLLISMTRGLAFAFLVLWFLFLPLISTAQTTAVTGTVKDSNGIVYAGATLKAQLVLAGAGVNGQPTVTVNNAQQCASAGQGSAPCQVPFQGTVGPVSLNPSGNFALNLQDNTLITPAATQWLFSVTTPGLSPPVGTGPQACTATLTISGASQSISASFAACPALSNSAGGTPGGTNGQVQFNNSGAFGGAAGIVYSGSGGGVTVAIQGETSGSALVITTNGASPAIGTAGAGDALEAPNGSSALRILANGNITGQNVSNIAGMTSYGTGSNCSSSASPAVCGSSASGSVVVAAAATTVQVNTTAVTANSQIQLTFDSSLGTKLGVTCNTTAVQPTVSARTGGTSFTITVPSAPVTNPACFSYTLMN